MESPSKTVIAVCSGAVLVCFLLPWAQFLGQGVSGYRDNELGSYGSLLWLVPASSAITLVLTLQNSPSQRVASVVAGILSWLGLWLTVNKANTDVSHVLRLGAYGTLAASGGLLKSALSRPNRRGTSARI